VNVGPRGVRRTVGLPGSGITHLTLTGWPKAGGRLEPSPAKGGRVIGWILAIAAVVAFGWVATRPRAPPARAPDAPIGTQAPEPASKALPAPAPRVLTTAEVRELQRILKRRGYRLGPVDGKVGPKTEKAIRSFERASGLPETGKPSAQLLELARSRQ
jgi:hypothetical protein